MHWTSPATIIILLWQHPFSRIYSRFKTFVAVEYQVSGDHACMICPVLKMTGLLPASPKCPGNEPSAFWMESSQSTIFPARSFNSDCSELSRRRERFQWYNHCFRIAGQPPVFKTPARRYSALIFLAKTLILSATQPIERSLRWTSSAWMGCLDNPVKSSR